MNDTQRQEMDYSDDEIDQIVFRLTRNAIAGKEFAEGFKADMKEKGLWGWDEDGGMADVQQNLLAGARHGDAKVQFKLGRAYYHGLFGFAVNYEEAVLWFTRSAQQGTIEEAGYYLGKCYLNGTGVEKDRDKAVYWLEKAAATGCGDAGLLLDEIGE
ncbi:MAG: sel1 repeat family protein [Oscillospiraceae bacterium]|jgi:TPR repeat protein|nr:sel1 repeat family protein [Oscillospiraceae bacterium]